MAIDNWKAGPLNQALVKYLPAFLNSRGDLDIAALKVELGRSHEAIYTWLRESSLLLPTNARRIVALAKSPDNLKELERRGITPPEMTDLVDFL